MRPESPYREAQTGHSSSLRKWLGRAGWFLLAIWFIAGAAIVFSRWFFTTQFPKHLSQYEAMLGEATGIDVKTGRLQTGFTLLRPVITLEDVALSRRNGPVSLHLPKVQAELAWSSIWHLEPRFQTLIISAPTLNVRRLNEKTFDIGGFTLDVGGAAEPAPSGEASRKTDIPALTWLLSQGRILIENGTFRYTDETLPEPLPVAVNRANIAFEQRLFDYRASLSGILTTDGIARPFDLRARLEKNIFSEKSEPFTWKGEAYADFARVDFARIMQRIGFANVVRTGSGAARTWISFDSGRITRLLSDINLSRVRAQIAPELEKLNLSSLSGRIEFSEDEGGMHFRADRLVFQHGLNGSRFGPATITADCAKNAADDVSSCNFVASEVSIGTLAKIASSLPLPHDALDFLSERPISGILQEASASFHSDYKNPSNWSFAGVFRGITVPPGEDGLPGIRNLSGSVRTDTPGEFDITLDMHYGALYFPGVFRNPQLNVTSLTGRVKASIHSEVSLAFEDIKVANDDLAARAEGTWKNSGGAGSIDISGSVERGIGTSVIKYLPNVIGDPALDYVEAAIMGGRITGGRFVVRGPLNAFPWDGWNPAEGEFRIEGDVAEGSMDFMPTRERTKDGKTWVRGGEFPVLNRVGAHLAFVGNRMTITGNSAKCGALSATDVKVEIPSFVSNPPLLTVDGKITGDFGEALGYLGRAGFLADLIGKPFEKSRGSGATEAVLSLRVPLGNGATEYSVDAALSQGTFAYQPFLPEVKNLSGKLTVSSKGISTPQVFRGSTAAGPVTASARSDKNGVTLDIHSGAIPEDLQRLVDADWVTPWFGALSGKTEVRTRATIPWDSKKPLRIEGESSLEGLASELPEPLGKSAQAKIPAKFIYEHDGTHASLSVSASPLINLNFGWQGEKLSRGYIGLGAPTRSVASGLEAAIRTEKLDLTRWTEFWEKLQKPAAAPQREASAAGSVPDISKLDFYAGNVTWKDQSLGTIDGVWRQLPGLWHLRVHGDMAMGQAEYAYETTNAAPRLTLKLNSLRLPEIAEDKTASVPTGTGTLPPSAAVPPKNNSGIAGALEKLPLLPDLRIVIDELVYGRRNVGKLEVSADNRGAPEGGRDWTLNALTIRNAGGTLTSSGRWHRVSMDDPGRSTLNSVIDVKDAGIVLSSLDIKGVLREAPGEAKLNLSWIGRPSGFNLQTLSGEVSAHTGAGQLLQVEPGAGRLLSLLSMQHLLRRLTLDFRDVISQGFRFDSFSTTSEIENGVIHVKRTTIAGSAATVVTSGDVDLVNNILDLKALVLPSINAEGASLALAIANPAVGLGTLLAQWVLKDQISNFLSTEYEVKGSIDDPTIEKIPFAQRQAGSGTQRRNP